MSLHAVAGRSWGLVWRVSFPLLALACQTPREPPPPALVTEPGTIPPIASAPDTEVLLGVGQADSVVAAMLRQVQDVRELSARSPVSSRVITRAEMIKQVRAHVERDVPTAALRGQGEFLTALGFLPPTFDFAQGLFDLLEAQVAGYYEPADKRMYLVSDLGPKETDATLAHELVHALQDQHYDLEKRMKFRDDQSDALGAVQALAEGDAMAGMMDIEAGGPGASLAIPDDVLTTQMRVGILLMPSTSSIPPIMRGSLVAPYADGVNLVQKLRRRGGFAEVDRVWRRPPETTEQVLHLDKLDAREPALLVPGPPMDAFGGGFRKLYGDSNGEQGLRLAFEEWGPFARASAAAAGWGGDHFDVLVRGEGERERFVTWWVRFDPGGKGDRCREADEAYAFIAERAYKMDPTKKTPDVLCKDRADLGPLAVARSRCDVVFAAGPFVRGEADRATSTKTTCVEVSAWLPGWVAKAGASGRSSSPSVTVR